MPPVTPPAEHSSVVSSALHGNEKERLTAVEQIIAAHWKVLYKYLRARHNIPPTVARTITLNFLDALQEEIFFEGFNETKFPVRVFLREKLDLFVASHDDRGDGAPSLPIDFTSAEEEFQMDQRVPGQSAEEYLESEWVRNVFTLAVEELNNQLSAEGKT